MELKVETDLRQCCENLISLSPAGCHRDCRQTLRKAARPGAGTRAEGREAQMTVSKRIKSLAEKFGKHQTNFFQL